MEGDISECDGSNPADWGFWMDLDLNTTSEGAPSPAPAEEGVPSPPLPPEQSPGAEGRSPPAFRSSSDYAPPPPFPSPSPNN